MEKLPVFVVIWIVVFSLGISYSFYMAWFKPEIALLNARKTISRIPNWYPLKWISEHEVNNAKTWIKWNRIGATSCAIFTLIFIVMLLINYL
jgi:hypothetical protein